MYIAEAIKYLLDNDYAILVNNQFVLTQKFKHVLESEGYVAAGQTIDLAGTQTTLIQVDTPPKIAKTDDKKELWNKFIKDTEIPWRVKASDGGEYTVRQFSASAVNKLISILSDPKIDYKTLVEATKSYYKTVSYKVLLSNYLIKGFWEEEYNHYLSKKGAMTTPGDGSNRFEE